MVQSRFCIVMIAVAVVALFASMLTGETPGGSGEWTKIAVKEAFISHQTRIDFRDPNSAPESGHPPAPSRQ